MKSPRWPNSRFFFANLSFYYCEFSGLAPLQKKMEQQMNPRHATFPFPPFFLFSRKKIREKGKGKRNGYGEASKQRRGWGRMLSALLLQYLALSRPVRHSPQKICLPKLLKKVRPAPRRYQTICAHLNIRYSTVPTYDAVRRRLLRASSSFLPFWPGSMNSPFSSFLKKVRPFLLHARACIESAAES